MEHFWVDSLPILVFLNIECRISLSVGLAKFLVPLLCRIEQIYRSENRGKGNTWQGASQSCVSTFRVWKFGFISPVTTFKV